MGSPSPTSSAALRRRWAERLAGRGLEVLPDENGWHAHEDVGMECRANLRKHAHEDVGMPPVWPLHAQSESSSSSRAGSGCVGAGLPGMTYLPSAQRPMSIRRQRSEQNGNAGNSSSPAT
jgi:hypothetical protein